ncbi:hypothetical protein KJ742_05680 [Patescibacteria group bacterium]|nr:hypothetical protein [Patescibacteria group bacterium]MBU1683407.1 hypothetical protein [Patescibacteria group bacterium]MBU1934791.1 hypothetical protein [Patescibacteria group bacterium]
MNKFLKNFDWSAKSIAKIIGMIILGIVAITVVIALISFSIKTIFNTTSYRDGYYGGGYDYDYAMEEASFAKGGAMMLSSMDYFPPIPEPGYSTGSDAEDYEVKEYYGTVNTRKLDETCETISNLKALDYVIFESSDKNQDACYYRFKVEKAYGDEIAAIVESLKPETFNASVESIKGTIEEYEDELDILTKKLSSIEETLEEAQNAYDEISVLATRQNDAETLAKIIDSKLELIERLSNEKLYVKEQIDRYNDSKAEQLDRLNYTFFNINIYKDLIFDWKDIKDSWKYEAKLLVDNVNEVFQGITLHLATYLVRFAQVVLYLLISLFLLKLVWIGVKYVWKGKYYSKKKR